MRQIFAALSGGLFGAGLFVSGMIDTQRVQGWLDVFGAWDPTLAFVLGGAILPMAVAWQIAARRKAGLLGSAMPPAPNPELSRDLAVGSMIFGAGWALAGFCPGPAMASAGFGGWQVWVFLVAMIAAMIATPALRARLPALSA